MKRIMYQIIINGGIKKGSEYTYDYNHTRNICIKIAQQKSVIKIPMTKKYNLVDYSNTALCKDVLKRVCWLHMLKYGRLLDIKTAKLQCDINADCLDIKELFPTSIIGKEADVSVAVINTNEALLKEMIKIPFYMHEKGISCLTSFMIAKSKNNIYERFVNLWISFNYYYKNLYVIKKGTSIENDHDGMSFALSTNGLGIETLTNTQRKERLTDTKLSEIAAKWDQKQVNEQSICDEHESIIKQLIQGTKANNNTPYGFLLTDYSYQLRCNYFHGGKNSNLLFLGTNETNQLRIANYVLEDFLNNHIEDVLQEFMDDNYLQNRRKNGKS